MKTRSHGTIRDGLALLNMCATCGGEQSFRWTPLPAYVRNTYDGEADHTAGLDPLAILTPFSRLPAIECKES